MFAEEPPSSSNPTKNASENQLCSDEIRRLLLRIGGANIAPRGSRRKPPTLSSLADEKHVGSLLRSTAARDPKLPADT